MLANAWIFRPRDGGAGTRKIHGRFADFDNSLHFARFQFLTNHNVSGWRAEWIGKSGTLRNGNICKGFGIFRQRINLARITWKWYAVKASHSLRCASSRAVCSAWNQGGDVVGHGGLATQPVAVDAGGRS